MQTLSTIRNCKDGSGTVMPLEEASRWKSVQDRAYSSCLFLLGELQPRDRIPGTSILVSPCGLSGSHPYADRDRLGDLDPCLLDTRVNGKSTG